MNTLRLLTTLTLLFSAQVNRATPGEVIMSSVDALNWVPVGQAAVRSQFSAIAYGAGQFVAVGEGIMTSTDGGVTWVSRVAGTTNRFFTGITYGNGQFAACSEDFSAGVQTGQLTGTTILTSRLQTG